MKIDIDIDRLDNHGNSKLSNWARNSVKLFFGTPRNLAPIPTEVRKHGSRKNPAEFRNAGIPLTPYLRTDKTTVKVTL